MLKLILRSASQNSPFRNDWGHGYGNTKSDRKVLVNHTVYRDNLLMNISLIKASFRMRDPYLVLKARGQLIIEMIPLSANQNDPTKKTLNPRDRYSVLLGTEAIFNLLHEKSTKNIYRKDSDSYELSSFDGPDGWEWNIIKNSNQESKRMVIMNKSERFYAMEFINFSIPYVQGWYAVGDYRIAEQNMIVESEVKDPFQNI